MSCTSQVNEKVTKENVWNYSNPIKKEYTELITITELSYNADVKNTNSKGVLVNEGRFTGGSYIWDCCDADSKKVVNGVSR